MRALESSFGSLLEDLFDGLSPVDCVMMAYGLAVVILMLATGRDHPQLASTLALHLGTIGLAGFLAIASSRDEDGALTDFFHGTYPFFLLAPLHYYSGAINQILVSRYFDPFFARLDRMLFGTELYRHLAPSVDSLFFDETMYFAYFFFYLLIAGSGVAAWLWRRERLEELTFAFSICMYSLFFFFIVFPVAGPTDVRAEILQSSRGFFGPLIHTLVITGDTAGGAFPSSHCAGSLVLLWYQRRLFGGGVRWWITAVLCALLWVSTVYLSFHYGVDVIAGLAVGLAFGAICPSLYERLDALLSFEPPSLTSLRERLR
jgi:membrane-associated phospholipid phosphatase